MSTATGTTETASTEAAATGRFEFCLSVALVAIAVGVVAGNAAVFLSSVVPLGYVAYGYATRPPEPDLAVDRRIDPESPVPGEDVSVVLSVTNDGTEPLPDVRIVDEPPAGLTVDGTARAVTSLEPGETTTLTYDLRARRGTHAFGDVTLVVRNTSASADVRQRITPAVVSEGGAEGDREDQRDDSGEGGGDDKNEGASETENAEDRRDDSSESDPQTIECDDAVDRMPLAGETIQHTGRVETDVGGEGLEFHSIRSFHPSDPMSRVDWKRLARTGELTTIEFREERAASVVVVVDVRAENALVRDRHELDGLALSKHAAGWVVTAALNENNRVGVALYGGRGDYLLPRTGRDQAARARQLLEGEWCGSFGRSGWLSQAGSHVDRFCRHLADEKQIVFVSPVLDDEPIESARRFRAHGHAVTLVCPRLADAETTGGRIERIDHRHRVGALREHGVRVIEWAPDESLHVAVDRAKRRWSR